MSRLLGLTVARNEEHRYLKPMLHHMRQILDRHFLYDDLSSDNTYPIALDSGCVAVQRTSDVPPFMENEGAFRAGAWAAFEAHMDPRPGDWVLVIDCDEVLLCRIKPSVATTRAFTLWMTEQEETPVCLHIPEVFGFDIVDDCPLVRTDRLWNTIHAPRLFPYRDGAFFARGDFGVPAVPSYVMADMGRWRSSEALVLMHYGYAAQTDQKIKYSRYSGRSGHSSAHVQSIIEGERTLERWQTDYVKEMRCQPSR